MRLMMERYNFPKIGYPEDGILKAYSEVAGQDMSAFYRRLVESTDELPYEEVLAGAGLILAKESGQCEIKSVENPTPEQRRILDGWSKGSQGI
jgi:predicted metalloprotease with PDZ domain